jgi:V/A-type H+/Na+-transporting ATPase subunit E
VTREGLIEALRRKAAEDAEGLWRDARAKADALRVEAQRAVADERLAIMAETAATIRRLTIAASAAGERAARDYRVREGGALAERLHRLARAELPDLREAGADAGFAALAAELPASDWRRLRVNPADEPAARRLFPMADVECDPTIAGGLRAEGDGRCIVVDNTLEARLESAWPDLLPVLIRSIETEFSDHRTAA